MHADEIWTKSYGLNYTKLWAFWQKKKMINYIWQSVDAILEDVPVTETTVWCQIINLKTIFQYLKTKNTVVRHV